MHFNSDCVMPIAGNLPHNWASKKTPQGVQRFSDPLMSNVEEWYERIPWQNQKMKNNQHNECWNLENLRKKCFLCDYMSRQSKAVSKVPQHAAIVEDK